MREKYEIDIIIELLSKWIIQIELNNALTLYDVNKISESLALRILNILYDLELKNLNNSKVNFCGIDLGDEMKSKIAFQITSRTDAAKIRSTLKKFVEKGYDKKYINGVRFLILSREKLKLGRNDLKSIYEDFDVNEHIITYNDLIRDISYLYSEDFERFNKLKKLLVKELSVDNTSNVIDNNIKINSFLDKNVFIKGSIIFVILFPIFYSRLLNLTIFYDLKMYLKANIWGSLAFALLMLTFYILLKISDNDFKKLVKEHYPDYKSYESKGKKPVRTTIHKEYRKSIQEIIIYNSESTKIDRIKGSVVLFENNVEVERAEFEEYNIETRKGRIVYKMKYHPEDRFEKMYWNEFHTYVDEIEIDGKILENIKVYGTLFHRTHFLLLNKYNYPHIGSFKVLPYEISWLKKNFWQWRVKPWFFNGHNIPSLISYSGKRKEPISYKFIRFYKKLLRILIIFFVSYYLYFSFKSMILVLSKLGQIWYFVIKSLF